MKLILSTVAVVVFILYLGAEIMFGIVFEKRTSPLVHDADVAFQADQIIRRVRDIAFEEGIQGLAAKVNDPDGGVLYDLLYGDYGKISPIFHWNNENKIVTKSGAKFLLSLEIKGEAATFDVYLEGSNEPLSSITILLLSKQGAVQREPGSAWA